MSFDLIFFIILLVYILILVLYFLRSKNLNSGFDAKSIATKPKEVKNTLHKKRSNKTEINILDSMFFLMNSLNEDSKKRNNIVLFDYDMSYPKNFNADATEVILLTDALTQIMLQNLSNSTIVIKFLLSGYRNKKIKFTISVRSDSGFCQCPVNQDTVHINMSKSSRNFLDLAKEIVTKNGSAIIFDQDGEDGLKISTDITLQLSEVKKDILKKLKIQNTKKFKALIAQSDRYAFEILKKELEFIGIDVKPTSDQDIIKRHIKDAIFKPQIVFAESKTLKDININELEGSFIDKKISLVIVQRDIDQIVPINPQIYTQYLSQPYTPDLLIDILNNAHAYGGGRWRHTL